MDRFKTPTNLINFTSIATAICLVIVIVVAVLVLWPKFQELKTIQENVKITKAELQIKQDYVLKLDDLRVKLEENQDEIAKIKTTLPNSPSIPSLLNYLQKTSSESGLILTEISPFSVSEAKDFANLKEATLSIKVSGSYSSFKSFLSSLEKSARLIEIENISFSSSGTEEPPTFNLNLKTFSY